MQISYTLATIASCAHQLWTWKHKYNVWTFSGDMGAGKTTLINALCVEAGVTDHVSSPTYALVNEYLLPGEAAQQSIFHMDWYRLRSEEEAVNAGIEDQLYRTDAFSFVEWPGQVPELLYKPYLDIRIEITGPTERIAHVTEVKP